MHKYIYTVILQHQADGGYHIFCPSLPGCHSEGETVDESLANIKEAIDVYLDSLKAHGEVLPQEDLFIKSLEVTA